MFERITQWLKSKLTVKLPGLFSEIHLRDNVTLELIRNGEVVYKKTYHNLIVDTGKVADAGLFNGQVTSPFKWVGVGTGTAAPASGNTALGSEVTGGGGARGTSATCSQVSGNIANDTAQLVKQFDFSASYAVTESGVFDASAAGTMAARQTFAAVNVASGDSLQVTWKVTKA